MSILSKNRRKVVKCLLGGSGGALAGVSIPTSWTKPVVNAVILPVHATTSVGGSGGETTPGSGGETTPGGGGETTPGGGGETPGSICSEQFCFNSDERYFFVINVEGDLISAIVSGLLDGSGKGVISSSGAFGFSINQPEGGLIWWLEGTVDSSCTQINGFFCDAVDCLGSQNPFTALPSNCQ